MKTNESIICFIHKQGGGWHDISHHNVVSIVFVNEIHTSLKLNLPIVTLSSDSEFLCVLLNKELIIQQCTRIDINLLLPKNRRNL